MLSDRNATLEYFATFSYLVSAGETVTAPELATRIEQEYNHNNSSIAEIIATLYEQESTTFTRPIH